MSVQAVRWATKVRGLTIQEKAVLFVLAEAHNGKTGKCFPSQTVIAEGAGMTEKTARKFIVSLQSKGILTRTVTSYGKGLLTFYDLHIDGRPPIGRALPTGSEEPNGRIVPFAPPHANGRAVPFGQGENRGDQTVKHDRPNGNCVPVAIEEPEMEPEISPSHSSDELFEGRDRDLFETASPSNPIPKHDDPPAATKKELLSEIVFKIGKPLLGRDGLSAAQAGAFLGKLIKNSNLEIVAKVVSQAAQSPPVDARGWITAAVHAEARKVGIRIAKSKAPPIDWHKSVAVWIDQGTWPRHLGDMPHEHGYAGPVAELEFALANLPNDHPYHRQIQKNLEARKQRA